MLSNVFLISSLSPCFNNSVTGSLWCFWMEIFVDGNLSGWKSLWIEIFVDGNLCGRKSLWMEIVVNGNLCGWKSLWMEIFVDENLSGWKSFWMKIFLDGNLSGWKSSRISKSLSLQSNMSFTQISKYFLKVGNDKNAKIKLPRGSFVKNTF